MKSLKITFLAAVIMTLSTASYAEAYHCVGMDGEGSKINVLYDEDTNTVNVNGNILKIQSGTQGKNGVATEDFEDSDGKSRYVSLVVEDKDKIVMREFDSKNDEELVVVPLACE